jgi:DedD protein
MSTSMSDTEDTEITLGTGKMLALFFGLVALCAVFFGMGFKLGKNSTASAAASDGSAAPTTATSTEARPSAVKPATDTDASRSADVAFYQSSGQKSAASQPASSGADSTTAASKVPDEGTTAGDKSVTADPTAAPSASAYYVQVAAVSKSDDGDALVDALKKKQYPAFSSAGPDKFFHVEVGPFADIKSAEDMRAKLITDGYNPILKK